MTPAACARSDVVLMQKVQNGDRESYVVLANRHAPTLGHYIARMLGSPADVEDIRQEVLLRLWTRGERWNPELAALTTWLHRIAHNLCIDHLRKNGRFSDELPDESPGGDEPDTALNQVRAGQVINEALQKLPERQRSAIILCHYQGLSNKAAAEILDVSVDALESLIARGKRSLRQFLIGEDQ